MSISRRTLLGSTLATLTLATAACSGASTPATSSSSSVAGPGAFRTLEPNSSRR